MIKSRLAFSLIEILIGMVFLTFACFGLLLLNQTSTRGTMDAQFEMLAHSLCQEPIEVFQHLGFAWVRDVANGSKPGLPAYPIGSWVSLEDPPFPGVMRPVDAVQFQRRIDVEPAPLEAGGCRGIRMVVLVAPVAGGPAAAWLSRNQVRQEALIIECDR